MTREELVLSIKRYFNSEEEAVECANDYTDEEIQDFGGEIVSEIDEDFRFLMNYNHYIIGV